MNATAIASQANNELDELKSRLKATWMTGDYDLFARYMEKGAEEFFERLGVAPGTRLLDVACGAGQLALIAARAGAQVTGCDIATNWLEKARARAAAEGLAIIFDEGDVESLPYEDGQFDTVVTLVGAMFAPRPDRVAVELTRVCRPSGRIAMANWTPGGFVGKMFRVIAKHIAPSGMPAPVLWGEENTVRERFRDGIADLRFAHRIYHFDYPFPPDRVVEFFRTNYGPMSRAFASLDRSGQESLRRELVQLWAAYNESGDDTTKVAAEYLEVIATRSPNTVAGPYTPLRKHKEIPSNRRTELLADRIEEGAAGLAAFAEGLSDHEWRTPVSASDQRTIGVIVHHVASMYPIEIEAAQAVATAKPVDGITWNMVAEINEKHANDQNGVSKAEALDLLRRNSRAAADAVRAFTDDELDRAAPFGLSYGAPVTAQFVIEDHALRHSWHHLARIRKALKR
jgi:SAM-dependent methyltransferase